MNKIIINLIFLILQFCSVNLYFLHNKKIFERRENEINNNFVEWLPKHVQIESGLFLLDRRSLSEGEVLLFKTKKSRHRAIAIMSSQQQQLNSHEEKIITTSRFSDSLTFKDWLRRVYSNGDKALKISVRTTEVVRPVLQHLYAATRGSSKFVGPIIIHANTFQGACTGSEKPVDIVPFLESAQQLLPEAILSLGWTNCLEKGEGNDWTLFNKLDWQQAFRLLQLFKSMERKEPILLNIRLNDAVHSFEVLEWLLGIDLPPIYLLLRGDVGDVVDSDSPLKKLAMIGIVENNVKKRRKLLFDLDESWKNRMRRFVALSKIESNDDEEEIEREKKENIFSSSRWLSIQFPSSNPSSSSPFLSSTTVLSPKGVAFLGWPNTLLLYDSKGEEEEKELNLTPKFKKQLIEGRLMFIFGKQTEINILPQRKSGMIIYLFDQEPELLTSSRIPNSIQAFIGYDGRISLENKNIYKQQLINKNNLNKIIYSNNEIYSKSSTGQLPKSNCYSFKLIDKGWRIEMEVWTEFCNNNNENFNKTTKLLSNKFVKKEWISQRIFIQLDIPISRRKSRNIAIGKSGDGAIDFLVKDLFYNGTIKNSSSNIGFIFTFILLFLNILFY